MLEARCFLKWIRHSSIRSHIIISHWPLPFRHLRLIIEDFTTSEWWYSIMWTEVEGFYFYYCCFVMFMCFWDQNLIAAIFWNLCYFLLSILLTILLTVIHSFISFMKNTFFWGYTLFSYRSLGFLRFFVFAFLFVLFLNLLINNHNILFDFVLCFLLLLMCFCCCC